MTTNSKLFDRIRIRPRNYEEPRPKVAPCEWEGCDKPGSHRAPKGNRAVGEYHNFCLEHVRHYNTAFNFFSGMSQEEMEENLRRTNATDGRPSWGFGAKPGAPGPRHPGAAFRDPTSRFADPLNIFARYNRARAKAPQQQERERPLHEPDRRALETLGFERRASQDEIKAAYKALVKIHHPDANGGDKSSEDRLRTIIAAYAHLRQRGFVGR